jgi:hypothetical protein
LRFVGKLSGLMTQMADSETHPMVPGMKTLGQSKRFESGQASEFVIATWNCWIKKASFGFKSAKTEKITQQYGALT